MKANPKKTLDGFFCFCYNEIEIRANFIIKTCNGKSASLRNCFANEGKGGEYNETLFDFMSCTLDDAVQLRRRTGRVGDGFGDPIHIDRANDDVDREC